MNMKSVTFSRRIKEDGQSTAITIPKDKSAELRLKKGDYVYVTMAKLPDVPEFMFDRNQEAIKLPITTSNIPKNIEKNKTIKGITP